MIRTFTPTNIAMGVACLALSACVENAQMPDPSGNAVAAPAFLSQQELQATLPGATVAGVLSSDNTTQYQKTYNAEGTTAGIAGGESYTSTWSIEGNRWCEQWGSGSACWLIAREGATQLRAYKSETDPFRNPFFIQ